MPDYQKLYFLMFNAATDVLQELDHLNIGTARRLLQDAQSRAEELYISPEGEEDPGAEESQETERQEQPAP